MSSRREGPIIASLGRDDARCAAIGRQQIGPVIGAEEILQRLDPGQQPDQIVLPAQRKHRSDQIVPHALLAQHDLEPVGEEIEECGLRRFATRKLLRRRPDDRRERQCVESLRIGR